MGSFLAARRKAIAGFVAVVLAWGPIAQQNGFHALDFWTLAAGLAGVLGVHEAPNDKDPDAKPWEPPVRDAGQAGVLTVIALALLCIALVVWLSQHTTITTH